MRKQKDSQEIDNSQEDQTQTLNLSDIEEDTSSTNIKEENYPDVKDEDESKKKKKPGRPKKPKPEETIDEVLMEQEDDDTPINK